MEGTLTSFIIPLQPKVYNMIFFTMVVKTVSGAESNSRNRQVKIINSKYNCGLQVIS